MKFKLIMAALCAVSVVKAETTDEQVVQKLEQLSELGRKISEQERLIESVRKRYMELINEYLDVKMRNEDKTKDAKKIRQELFEKIISDAKAFREEYYSKLLKTDKTPLINEMKKNADEDQSGLCGLIKYYFIYEFCELGRLISLFDQWEALASQLGQLI